MQMCLFELNRYCYTHLICWWAVLLYSWIIKWLSSRRDAHADTLPSSNVISLDLFWISVIAVVWVLFGWKWKWRFVFIFIFSPAAWSGETYLNVNHYTHLKLCAIHTRTAMFTQFTKAALQQATWMFHLCYQCRHIIVPYSFVFLKGYRAL